MKPTEMMFRRRFSLNFYKNLKLKLGEMSFTKDFVNTTRGDLYPILASAGAYTEEVSEGRYRFTSAGEGRSSRLLGQFFPYATYEMTLHSLCGEAGFTFILPEGRMVAVGFASRGTLLEAYCRQCGEEERVAVGTGFKSGIRLVVTVRRNAFDLYYDNGQYPVYIRSFIAEGMQDAAYRKVFMQSVSAVSVVGSAVLSSVTFGMDCGISQADIRPIRYENGEVMLEQGKLYLTMSIRMQEECYQGVFSWIPGTAEFALTGALFYDAGDDLWGNDVAASILYHRGEGMWYIWVCSFCRGHILGHAAVRGDVRFGVNVIDITLMDKLPDGASDAEFLGKRGDEDPDFFYDEESGLWKMAVCRVAAESGAYSYFFFESKRPFDGYHCVGRTESGAETGGSFVKIQDALYFICGNSFEKRADYRVYRWGQFDTFGSLRCDYDDGGFRGWGTVIPCPVGARVRYFWLTFDRHGGSSYNWSYGNLYCFEADDFQRTVLPE